MVGVISAGLALLVAGETQFDALGFALVMAASALSGLRWTITQLQLQGSDGHGAAPVAALPNLRTVQSNLGWCRAPWCASQGCLPVGSPLVHPVGHAEQHNHHRS